MRLWGRYGIELRVRGELGAGWSTMFADLAVDPEPDGTTIIRGEVRDQAALHGVLAAVRDLGLSLISVAAFVAPDPPSRPDKSWAARSESVAKPD